MKSAAYESFLKPDDKYRGTDFFMLNGPLDEGELVRQMTEMKRQGFSSFIARTYVGLESDYPGPDFMGKMRVIVENAKKLGMKLYLQAGYMPDSVVDLPDEYKLRWLIPSKAGNGGGELLLSQGGFDYRVSRAGEFIDMFNNDAVEYYVRVSYDEMWREFSDEFGKTVASVWIDEPSYPASHLPFPRGIEGRFFERYGYSILDKLDALYFDTDGYKTVRYHYWTLLRDMLEKSFFATISDWCHAHGLLMSGHLLFEETLELQISRAAALMPYYKYLDVPGVDVLCAQQNWSVSPIKPASPGEYRYRESMLTTPIQCASAARQAGMDTILCEMYGVTSENLGPREQKHMFDYMAAHGVNRRSIHGIFYSLGGRAKRLYPPHVNYYQPYFSKYHLVNDYDARVARFASIGNAVRDTLVIHPLDSAYTEYTSAFDARNTTGITPSREALIRRDKLFARLISTLTLSGAQFDLGDEGDIAEMGRVADGEFKVGAMSYSTVVLPSLATVRKTTLERLLEFAEVGGRIIVLGDEPSMVDGMPVEKSVFEDTLGIDRVSDIAELASMLKPSHYKLSTDEGEACVIVSERCDGEAHYYFLVNTDCHEEKHIHLSLEGERRAERWYAEDGRVTVLPIEYENGESTLSLTLPEGGSALIAVTEGKTSEKRECHTVAVTDLGSKLEFLRDDPNALLLEFCSYKKERESFGDEYPILAIQHILEDEGYTGDIELKYSFWAECALSGVSLSLENAELAEITLNGERVSAPISGYYLAREFAKLPLPDLKEGRNTLVIKRYFSPPNRVYGGGQSLFISRGGTSLEASYLIGDFAVNMIPEPERNGDLRYSRHGVVLGKESGTVSGELTRQGYPFFAGTVLLKKSFSYEGKTEGATLKFDTVAGAMLSVSLNGVDCGTLMSAPYELDTRGALLNGENTIELRLTGTIRNLIGPHHRPDGERGIVRGDYDNTDLGWMGCANKDDKTWHLNRVPDTPDWTDSYLFVPFGVYGISLIKR